MTRTSQISLFGFLVVAIGCGLILRGESPVAGSRIEFLNDRAVQNCYGYVKFPRRRLSRAQVIHLADADFLAVRNEIATRVPGWFATSYPPMALELHKAERGTIYSWGDHMVTIFEKKRNGRLLVEVSEYEFLDLRRNVKARLLSAGRDLAEPRFIKITSTSPIPLD